MSAVAPSTEPNGLSRSVSRSGGLMDRVRLSFSSSRRPSISQSPRSESRSRFDSSTMPSGGLTANGALFNTGSLSPADGRLRKRRSIFRKGGRHDGKAPPIPLQPPQLVLPSSVEKGESVDDAVEPVSEVPAAQTATYLASRPTKQKYAQWTAASPKKRFESHQKARLSLRQATSLFEQCATEIKMRGLAMVGIFRPFRYAESPAEVERLIELFLLSSAPQIYQGIFALESTTSTPLTSSSMLRDTLGKPNPEAEFKRKLSYAHVFDVVALLKWGLRRMDIGLSDLRSAQQYTWYEDFVEQEKSKGYPSSAFSTLLLPTLSSDLAKAFKILFDLMSTISAHHLTNAMPAQRITGVFGYWLFGRISNDENPANFSGIYAAWEKAQKTTEHLLLAYIREQSSQFHLMPSRLTELVQNYPYIAPDAEAPSLPPSFIPRKSTALLVESRTENVILTPKQPRRRPREILRAAMKSQNADIEASEDLDDWTQMVSLASEQQGQDTLEIMADGDETGLTAENPADYEGTLGMEEAIMFADEDTRVLDIVETELQRHKDLFDGKIKDHDENGSSDAFSSYDSMSSLFSRKTFDSSSNENAGLLSSPSRASSLARVQGKSLTTLSETAEENGFDWGAFSSSGFASSTPQVDRLDFDKQFRPKNELERVFEEQDRVEALALEKKMRRRAGKNGAPFVQERRGPPQYILSSISTLTFDDCFAACWQDQLLDECPSSRLPYLVCAQLNPRMSSNLLGNAAKISNQGPDQWLIVHETVVQPLPPMPPSTGSSSTFFRLSTLSRKQSDPMRHSIRLNGFDPHNDDWRESGPRRKANLSNGGSHLDDDRQSLFSIRSGFSAHFARPVNGLRRMRSMLSTRRAASSGLESQSEIWSTDDKRQAEIDEEVKELQAAVESAKRERLKQQTEKENGPEIATLPLKNGASAIAENGADAIPTALNTSTTSNSPHAYGGTDYAKGQL